jgi:hypothetical protein
MAVRGPSPSIVCPRCGLVAPPSDVIAPFTTCTGCGLSFESSPKERAVRPSRPPRPPEPDPEPEPPPRHRGPALRWYQIIGIVVALLVVGAVKYQYSWRYRDDREKLEAIERENQQDSDRRQRQLDKLQAMTKQIKTGIASCDDIIAIQFNPIQCRGDDATAEVAKVFKSAYGSMMTATSAGDMDQLCTKGLAEIAAARKRVDCN